MLKTDKLNTAVFVSGGGTNLQALIDAEKNARLNNVKLALVISSNINAYAIERAKSANIPFKVIEYSTLGSLNAENEIVDTLKEHGIELIVLAGFMKILSAEFTRIYAGRIINIHPSLIPAFCGKGYYGLRVHEEALRRGVKLSGATVHYVNEIPDGGEIIMQKCVRVQKGDTPQVLQKRIMERAEYVILPKAVVIAARKLLKERIYAKN